jgi:hypothetical protein
MRAANLILAVVLLLSFSAVQFAQQLPPIGINDTFGLRTVSEADVLRALAVKPGSDALETLKSQQDILARIRLLPNVADASLSLVCCDDKEGKSILFVGVREKGTPPLTFRPAPKGNVRLPAEILKAGEDFEQAFTKALEAKEFTEDDSQGHALYTNKETRAVQERFVTLATPNLAILRRVIRESYDAKQRALAAQVIAYARDKRSVVDDLAYAMTDPDGGTRNNAMRALIVIAKYAYANPQLKIKVPTLPFVRMLNSLEWTDRNKSAGALDALTIGRDPQLLAQLKRESLDSLAEMARWKNPGHAQSSFNILSRLAGMTENEINAAWAKSDRKQQVSMMLDKIKR